MVYLRHLTGLLLALAAAPSVLSTPVAVGENGLVARVAEPQGGLLNSLLGGGDDNSSTSGANARSSSNPPPATTSNTPSATPTRTTPSATPTNSPSTSNSPTNSPSQTSSPQQTSTPAQTTSVPAITSVAQARTTIQASGTQSQLVIVDVVYTTTGGAVVTSAATQAVPSSTDAAQSTTTPPPADPNKTARTVGGAVGGVAGFILVVALIAVAWRIWGKNRKRHEEDDHLMDDGVYGTSEVKATSGPTTTASPFQNNLEQYHNGKTNPSANF